MEYIYPARFHANDDGSYTVTYPDLPGCVSEGKTLGDALRMAQLALNQWMEYLQDKKQEIPDASAPGDVATEDGEFVNLVRAETKDGRAVRRTVSIPKWMDDRVTESGLSLSRILQDALNEKLPSA
ncbi:MAG: type II toxin-antitoxin system HicB family antitoxin [Synergistaceae bacterium]|jgi:predicted RNase H-like HicB family nuclease|nr:type II toxin-antitoxin system HicB family antitoxin [Synergistaceae bacterium]